MPTTSTQRDKPALLRLILGLEDAEAQIGAVLAGKASVGELTETRINLLEAKWTAQKMLAPASECDGTSGEVHHKPGGPGDTAPSEWWIEHCPSPRLGWETARNYTDYPSGPFASRQEALNATWKRSRYFNTPFAQYRVVTRPVQPAIDAHAATDLDDETLAATPTMTPPGVEHFGDGDSLPGEMPAVVSGSLDKALSA